VRPVKSAPRSLLVNRFTVLNIEEVNTDICEPIDTPPPSAPVRTALSWRPKWEKRLPCLASLGEPSTLNTGMGREMFQVLIPFVRTKSLSMKLPVAPESKSALTECTSLVSVVPISIGRMIDVLRVSRVLAESCLISEVVDVVLCYKTHSERMLLAVSNLGKQSMILGYTWLKDHNPEVNWQTGEVQMNQCPPRCEGCRVIQKEQASRKKVEAKAVNIC